MNENDSLNSYLSAVCKNILYKKLRKNKNVSKILSIEDYQTILKDNFNTEDIYEEKEKIDAVKKILEEMDKESRNIFMLFYYEQRKIEEISIILGISKSNVKTKLHRIRKKIKNNLLKGGYRYE